MNVFSATGGFSHDPSESKSLDGNTTYCSYSFSCGSEEKPCYLDCVAFGKTAELILKYKKKGDKAHISGHFETKDKQDGTKRLVLVTEKIEFLAKATNDTPF